MLLGSDDEPRFADEALTLSAPRLPRPAARVYVSRRGMGGPEADARQGDSGSERWRKRAKFHGSMPALVTPFKDGTIDEEAFAP